MKKKMGLLISAILALCLAACGADTTGSDQSDTNSTPAVSSEPEAGNVPTAASTEDVSDELDERTSNTLEAETTENFAGTETTNSRILIAYFSVPEDVDTSGVDAVAGASIVVRDEEVMGNTEYVARVIQQTVGGDLFRIETTDQYPLDHEPLVDQAAEEQSAGTRPELAAHIENPDQYDIIILGFPNWWGDMPQPLYTFLEEYDFGGKTIIPFVTHGGSGFSGTRNTIAELQPDAQVSDNTLSLSRNSVAGSEEDVISWAENIVR